MDQGQSNVWATRLPLNRQNLLACYFSSFLDIVLDSSAINITLPAEFLAGISDLEDSVVSRTIWASLRSHEIFSYARHRFFDKIYPNLSKCHMDFFKELFISEHNARLVIRNSLCLRWKIKFCIDSLDATHTGHRDWLPLYLKLANRYNS